MHQLQHRRNHELLMETPAVRPDSAEPDIAAARAVIAEALAEGGGWLAPERVAALLGAYGIPLPETRLAADPEAAAAAASAIGWPVVLKVRSPDITHKTDIGGVALNLGNPDRVRGEAARMLARIRAAQPQARVEGFVVQPMVTRPGAIELIVGLADDAVFGPVVIFGQGGRAVELLHDTTL
jgi:acetyltransferase